MPDPIHGRCLCGAITIELTPPTDFCSHCHCQSCRRAHGAPLVTWTGVGADQLRFVCGEDNLERYQSSPGTYRCFCRTCGTSMVCYYTEDSRTFGSLAGKMYVPVAVLTDPIDQPPDGHVSFEEHVDWFDFDDGLPRYRSKSEERMG
jgi:hypothetical protein